MTTLQKLTVRASEIRQKLNELAAVETLTDEQRTDTDKLSTEYRDVETKLRAATVVDGVVDLEDKAKPGRRGQREEAYRGPGQPGRDGAEHRGAPGERRGRKGACRGLQAGRKPDTAFHAGSSRGYPGTFRRGTEASEHHTRHLPHGRALIHGCRNPSGGHWRSCLSGSHHERHRTHSGRERFRCRDYGIVHRRRAVPGAHPSSVFLLS